VRQVFLAVAGAALCFVAGCGARHIAPPSSPGEARVRRITLPPGLVVEHACTPTGPELCFNAVDDNCNGLIDEGCGEHTGLIQFVIAWDKPKADVDLDVTDPNGELIEPGRIAKSGLTKERDCPGQHDECHGQNLENVYLAEGDPLRGVYRVRIRLEKLGGENPPVHVRFGARVGPKTYAFEFDLERPQTEREIDIEL
jgi:hypothetical protein